MLRAIIVDDEDPARSELRFLLTEQGQVETVAEAASVREAIEKLHDYPCDVIFLDINMPEVSGLRFAEVLQKLKYPPQVVFVTAYSKYALDAFDVSAVDYLLKPVESKRLDAAVKRVLRQVKYGVQEQKAERLVAEKGGKKVFLGIERVCFAVARDDYANIHTVDDRLFSTSSLAQLEKRLEPYGFMRVHRSYLVNLSMVEELETLPGGSLLVSVKGAQEKIPVSRRKIAVLKKALGFR